jgi:hypothetical protein
LSEAWIYYFLGIVGLILCTAINPVLGLISYFAIGVWLNRTILRRAVSWHPVYNTLGRVVQAKKEMFFLWPLAYLRLLIVLIVNRVI